MFENNVKGLFHEAPTLRIGRFAVVFSGLGWHMAVGGELGGVGFSMEAKLEN